MKRLIATSLLLSSVAAVVACGSESNPVASEDDLRQTSNNEWFYDGPLPPLDNPSVVVSLKSNTAHVTGYLPAGTTVPDLPHMRTEASGDRTKVDLVYPIATARPGKSNSSAGVYHLQMVKPYRPDGQAYTAQEGAHFVTWGGFPFVAYNGGIAFHGPITFEDNKVNTPDLSVWYLRRGRVSGGCNRMMGEHVVELAHVLGISMRKVYTADRQYTPPVPAPVKVVTDYDTYKGKQIDVDYPTDVGVARPTGDVEMFGSWIATETPDGSDLPPDMKWEGGKAGAFYVFSEHARKDVVCSVPKGDLGRLATFIQNAGGELPHGFCAKKSCVLDALKAGADARQRCGL